MKRRTTKLLSVFIGIYQIIGGGFGLFSLIYGQIINKLDITFISIGVFLVFSFSIFAGISLVKSYNEKSVKYTLINQYFQIIKIKLVGFGFQYVAGSYFALGFSDTPRLCLQYKYALIKSACFVWPGTDNEISVMINLVPLIIIIIISRLPGLRNKEHL